MAEDQRLTSALNLMRRMPPSTIENSLAGLIELVPDMTDDLLNHVDQPLQVQEDPKTGQQFILCDYNRDGDSFRSPWSNEYYPAMEDGFLPSPKLREMEIQANEVFNVYRKMYYDTGHSSVYFFNTDEKDDAFGACFLIHKDVLAERGLAGGWWDSIHVADVSPTSKPGTYTYKLTSTVMVSMAVDNDNLGAVDLSGSMTQQTEKKKAIDSRGTTHIANLGSMIEEMELRIRNSIEAVYIQKTREVLNGMRKVCGNFDKEWSKIIQSMQQATEGKEN